MEKQLSGGEELRKIMCKRYPDYPDISSKEFFELIEICFQEGRQSKLKEVLGMIDKLSITQKEGCPVTIKAGTRFIFTEELKKELTGVKGK